MSRQRPFRFGVSVNKVRSKEEWIATARKVESLGYSTLLMPDHLGDQLAPLAALMAAAEATQKLTIPSPRFDHEFRPPVNLAKERGTPALTSVRPFVAGARGGWDRL